MCGTRGTSTLFPIQRIQRLHFDILVVIVIFDMLVPGASPRGHFRESILVDLDCGGLGCGLGRIKACGLLSPAIRWRSWGWLVTRLWQRGRRFVEWSVIWSVIVMFGCFVSAPARRTAAATAAFAALVSTAEAIEDACEHGKEDDRPNDDTNDDGPPRQIRSRVQVCAG